MRRILLVAMAVLLSVGQLFAAPVDVEKARSIGDKFVKNNLKSFRNFKESRLVYTLKDDNGITCLYIFNIDDKGFYVVSADDRAKPILAYSEESAFDVNNIPVGLNCYLNNYKDAISYVVANDLEADPVAAEEWSVLKTRGTLDRKISKTVEPLIDLLWDQEYPYNYYCPSMYGGPGGRAYAGCVADAMAMIMKYWNYPDAGVGEHSYTPQGLPEQSVVYGEAYDWDNMPNQLSSYSPANQIEAVAKLMYHCGVSVDMQYGADGSGTYSSLIPDAMSTYFKYTKSMLYQAKNTNTQEEWMEKLIANFDQGFPVLYGGYSEQSGGHAFICDGYDENLMFHFNWGWSGWCNGYFAIDAVNPSTYNFTDEQNAIFDMVPDYVYDAIATAPVVEVERDADDLYKGFITVTVPSRNVLGMELENIDKLVLLRGDEVIYTEDNPTPGETLTFEDNVDDNDAYAYYAYAVVDDIESRMGKAILQYGPMCEWKFIGMTTNFQGWNNGKLRLLNSKGNIFREITLTSSTTVNESIQVPEGSVTVLWVAPRAEVASLTIKLKDAADETVYSYSGPSKNIPEGELVTVADACNGVAIEENYINAKIYPNPSSGLINIEMEGLTHVVVYNALGQIIVKQEVDVDEYVLDMQQFEKGIYLLQLVTKENDITQRITITD